MGTGKQGVTTELGQLWEPVTVLSRMQGNQVVVYRCFRNVLHGGYAVQSADRLYQPVELSQMRALEEQWWELFFEQDPGRRSGVFPTIAEAISAFESGFQAP